MATKLNERVVSWSVDEFGVVQFHYSIGENPFLFNVTPETQQDVLRNIYWLAESERSPLTRNDADYLASMVQSVMEMQCQTTIEDDDASIYVGNDLYIIGWLIMMMCCSATFCVALFVFFVWGW